MMLEVLSEIILRPFINLVISIVTPLAISASDLLSHLLYQRFRKRFGRWVSVALTIVTAVIASALLTAGMFYLVIHLLQTMYLQ